MPSAFPIRRVCQGQVSETVMLFNEDSLRNSLLNGNGLTFDYLLGRHHKDAFGNYQNIYMKRKLDELRALMEHETSVAFSITDILDNKCFKRIVEFGPAIVPLLLEELRYNANYLVWAINLITGRKISNQKISLSEAAKLWLNWGKTHKLIG